MEVNRRAFTRSALGAFGALVLPTLSDPPTLRFAVMEVGDGYPFGDGALLGYMEALQAARLFRRGTLELVTLGEHGVPSRAAGVATSLARKGVKVIVGGLNDDDTRTAALECAREGVMLINCRATADDLRRTVCSPLVFHVEASKAMYTSARALAPRATEIVLWSDRLEKYGASQLNDRFRAAEGAGMTSRDWAGWFAIKAIWESFLRVGKPDPMLLARYMTTGSVAFDGHKGAPLSFRKWDRQLRQPLYAVPASSSAPPRDIPDTSRSSQSIRELLDALGDDASAMKCAPP